MSARFIRQFRLIGLGAALILAIIFKEKIFLIAGVYWALVILLTIALKFVNPDEYAKLKSEPEEKDQDEEDMIPESTEESEDDEEGVRDSLFKGKYSFQILTVTFLAVLIGGIIIIVCTGVPYDESQVYFAKENFFNRRFGDLFLFQLAPLVIASFLTSIGCVSTYEILTGVVTRKEKEKYRVSLCKSILLAVGPAVLALVMLFVIQNWATVLTEEGVEVYRPWKETASYRWDDMVAFTYEEADTFTRPEVDIEFENGEKINVYFGHFERISKKAQDVYASVWEGDTFMIEDELFFRHIFLEKYGHLIEAD